MSKPALLVPSRVAAQKPPHGAPCNQCGLCCKATLCPLAAHVFKGRSIPQGGHIAGPCPALFYEGEQSRCGLVAKPAAHAPMRLIIEHSAEALGRAASWLIGSGTGCDARIDGEPASDAFYKLLSAWDYEHRREVRWAKKIWDIR